jgi:hypothetical protein
LALFDSNEPALSPSLQESGRCKSLREHAELFPHRSKIQL